MLININKSIGILNQMKTEPDEPYKSKKEQPMSALEFL